MAIKIQRLTPETQSLIVEEYRILRDFAGHPNLPDFYGIYRKRSAKKSAYDEIWFVMEVSSSKRSDSQLVVPISSQHQQPAPMVSVTRLF